MLMVKITDMRIRHLLVPGGRKKGSRRLIIIITSLIFRDLHIVQWIVGIIARATHTKPTHLLCSALKRNNFSIAEAINF